MATTAEFANGVLIGVWQVPRRDRAQDRLAPPAYRLPPRNTNFTGRDATLREVRQCLTSRNGVAMVAVQGLGGVGKTQLAIEYAYRYLSKYRFVAFVGAEDSDLVASHFVSLAGQLGLTEVSSDQAIPRVYGKLLDHRPWLIIFDNGEKPGTLTHALPSGGLASNGHVIVTTRVSGWSGRAKVIDLDVFTRQESVKLLVRRVPGMTEAVADRIAEQLGDLPLALEQAAGYMGYNHAAPEEYLTLLTSRLEEMIARGELTDRPEAEEVVVASLWSLSVERLNTDQPQAVRLLELCALLAPEPIPLDLFTGSPETLNGAAADALVWDTTVGALAGLGLARRENASLVLHRLVQAAIRAPMPDEVRTGARVQLCRALLAAVPHDIHGDPDARPRWQELLPHVIAVTKDDPPAECAAETAVLLRLASEFLIQIGDCSVALPLCERALAIDESLEGRDAEAYFDLITLAQIHKDLNAPETARPLAERALRLHESCLPHGQSRHRDGPGHARAATVHSRRTQGGTAPGRAGATDRRDGVWAGRPVRELRPDRTGERPRRPRRLRHGRAADLAGAADPRGPIRAGPPVHRVRPAVQGPSRAQVERPVRSGPRAPGRTDPAHPTGQDAPQDRGCVRSGQRSALTTSAHSPTSWSARSFVGSRASTATTAR